MERLLNIFLLLCIISTVTASEPQNYLVYYHQARQYAYDGDYNRAIKVCDSILAYYPGDMDALLLKARIKGWMGQYSEARGHVLPLYKDFPNDYDVLDAISDIEYWDNKYNMALNYVDEALETYPDDSLFLSKKEKLESIMAPDPDTVPVSMERCLFAGYYLDLFNEFYKRRWHVFTLGIKYQMNSKLTLIPEINAGYLSPIQGYGGERSALQANFDAYYKITGSQYLYGNYGYSPFSLFPNHRAGLELFSDGPFGVEISAGLRYMKWTNHLFYVTGSVSKYQGNFWFSFRPYILLYQGRAPVAYMVSARYYMDPSDYFGVSYVFGAAPDQSFDLLRNDITYKSNKIVLSLNKKLYGPFSIFASLSYSYDEYQVGQYQNRFETMVRLSYCF